MTNFSYQAKTPQGQTTRGEMEAANIDAVAAQLIGRGVTPIVIREAAKGPENIDLSSLMGPQKVELADLIMFCRQMYTITKSGIPLVKGIRGLAASLRHVEFQRVLNDVADRLESGITLSVSMSKHHKVFNHLFISMVTVGESTGSLDEVFKQLAFYMERDDMTAKSIKSATRYPLFVVVALFVAVTVVNVAVIPKFADMFSKFTTELPIFTRILIGMSDVFINYWWLLILVVTSVVGGFWYYIHSQEGAIVWGKYKLRMPLIGHIIERASMARYARSFSLMLRAGVPINNALTLCSKTIDNAYLESKIEGIRKGVERGESLLKTHVQSDMLTPLVIQMISVGEESGKVDELLGEVADFYEREVDFDLKKLSDKIEPILIVIMAGFVTILALGIFLPMWDMFEIQK